MRVLAVDGVRYKCTYLGIEYLEEMGGLLLQESDLDSEGLWLGRDKFERQKWWKTGTGGTRTNKKGCSKRGKPSAWEKEMSGYWGVK